MKKSAGILIYKFDTEKKLKVFLVHPGGPFWKDKDAGAWSIPKGECLARPSKLGWPEGEIEDGEEDLLAVARRELKEETGIIAPAEIEKYFDLGEVILKSGKVVKAWAYEGDWNGLLICSSYAPIEWPYKSGKMIKVPEVDRAGFFNVENAKVKINERQVELIKRLEEKLK